MDLHCQFEQCFSCLIGSMSFLPRRFELDQQFWFASFTTLISAERKLVGHRGC
jgi:hypothetical protein